MELIPIWDRSDTTVGQDGCSAVAQAHGSPQSHLSCLVRATQTNGVVLERVYARNTFEVETDPLDRACFDSHQWFLTWDEKGSFYNVEDTGPHVENWNREDPDGLTERGNPSLRPHPDYSTDVGGDNFSGSRLRLVTIEDPAGETGTVLAPVYCPESSDSADIAAVTVSEHCKGEELGRLLEQFKELIDCNGVELVLEFDAAGHLYRIYTDLTVTGSTNTMPPIWCRESPPENTVGVMVRVILDPQQNLDHCCSSDSNDVPLQVIPEDREAFQVIWLRFDPKGLLRTVYFEKLVDCCLGSTESSVGGKCCEVDFDLKAVMTATGGAANTPCFTWEGPLTSIGGQRWIGEIVDTCVCSESGESSDEVEYTSCWEVDIFCDDDFQGGGCQLHRLVLRLFQNDSSDCDEGEIDETIKQVTDDCKCNCDESDGSSEGFAASTDSSDQCFFLEYDIPVTPYLTIFLGCVPASIKLRIVPA